MRVVIVDDEEPARLVLREYLAQHPDVQIVAECANGFDAIKAVNEHQPDLLLLDVQMPKLDGFEVLELTGGSVPVVFVTAFDQYAIRAFEVHAADYLLKPFSAERLAEALDRVRGRAAPGAAPKAPPRELAAAGRARRLPADRILIRDRSEVHVVPAAKIDYVEAQDDYVAVHTGGRTHLKEQTLTELETQLDPRAFVRIHRRYLLNITRLAKIEVTDTDSRTAVLADGTKLPISRSGYNRLRERLEGASR